MFSLAQSMGRDCLILVSVFIFASLLLLLGVFCLCSMVTMANKLFIFMLSDNRGNQVVYCSKFR
jgi:hypothetical protein